MTLKKIGVKLHKSSYDNGNVLDYEFHQVYIAQLNKNIDKLEPQEDEVEALKLVTHSQFEELLEMSEFNSHFVPTNKPYYQFVLNAIKSLGV